MTPPTVTSPVRRPPAPRTERPGDPGRATPDAPPDATPAPEAQAPEAQAPAAPAPADPHTSPLPPDAPAPRRVRAIDGLRGLAVSAVVLYHLFPALLPGGYLGVDVFFVISGFVITASLVHSRRVEGRPRLVRFWVRRAQRLLPALAAVLLVASAGAALVGDRVSGRLREQLLAALTFTSNWFQAGADFSYFDHTDPPLLQHLWSLAVEEQFYLAWPLLLLVLLALVRRPRARVVVVLAAAAASAGAMAWLYTPGEDPSRLYFGTDTHGFGLLLGAAAALAVPLLADDRAPTSGSRTLRAVQQVATHPLTAVVTMLTILAALARLADDRPETYRGGIALVSALTALLLIGFVTRSGGPVRAVLATPLMVWLGERSYGLYLWHWPVLVLVRGAFPEAPAAVRGAVVIYLTLLAASLSWRYLERPVLRHGFRGAGRRAAAAVRRDLRARGPVLVAVTTALVGCAAWGVVHAPERGQVEASVLAGQRALAEAGDLGTGGPDAVPTPEEPAEPLLAGATPAEIGAQTVVVGDSVALASAPGLLAAMPGIGVDAAVGRQLAEAAGVLTALRDADRLRPFVVVALGTNGDFAGHQLDAVLDVIGPDRRLVLVTAHGDRDWMPTVNAKLLAFAELHPEVALARWDQTSAQVTDFAPDGIHPDEQGGGVFAQTVLDALRTLR